MNILGLSFLYKVKNNLTYKEALVTLDGGKTKNAKKTNNFLLWRVTISRNRHRKVIIFYTTYRKTQTTINPKLMDLWANERK